MTSSPAARHERSQEQAALWSVARLQHCHRVLQVAEQTRTDAVVQARRQGATWPQIAAAIGVTRQGALQRYGHLVVDVDDELQLVIAGSSS